MLEKILVVSKNISTYKEKQFSLWLKLHLFIAPTHVCMTIFVRTLGDIMHSQTPKTDSDLNPESDWNRR